MRNSCPASVTYSKGILNRNSLNKIAGFLSLELWSLIGIMILRAILMFAVTLIAIRIMGKRSIAQFAPFDLVVIIIIGSAAALPLEDREIHPVIGVVPIIVLSTLQYLLALINVRFRGVEKITQGMSTPIVINGQVQRDNLKRENVSDADLHILLRQAGGDKMEEIALAVLEPTGQVSVIKKKESQPLTLKDVELSTQGRLDLLRDEVRSRRHMRYRDMLGSKPERFSPGTRRNLALEVKAERSFCDEDRVP